MVPSSSFDIQKKKVGAWIGSGIAPARTAFAGSRNKKPGCQMLGPGD
jgi:hypothetical protein